MVSQYTRPFRCEILTPEETVCDEQAVSVVLPTQDGQMGILGGRAPMVAMAAPGGLAVHTMAGQMQEYFIGGGFAQVSEGRLTLLVEKCVPVEALDREEVWEELQAVRLRRVVTVEDACSKSEEMAALRVKFRLAQKRSKQERS